MGRLSTFSDEDVFKVLSAQIASGDGVRLQALVDKTGVSMGSLYHRYKSREGVMASAWLHALKAFRSEFVDALAASNKGAGEQAALVTPRFSRQHRTKAVILALGRKEEFFSEKTPLNYKTEIDAANADMFKALLNFSERSQIPMEACSYAIVAFPLAAVKLFLPSKPVPRNVDDYVLAAYQSAIRVGRLTQSKSIK